MAISKTHSRKEPNQNPTDFYLLKQFGGARGQSSQKVPEKLSPQQPTMEKVYGKKDLA